MKELADKILEDREKRYNHIIDLLNAYKLPVLCAKTNYPGTDKNTKEAVFVFNRLCEAITEIYQEEMVYSDILEGADGKSFLAVLGMDGAVAKIAGISIEESHKLGRLFDIDIYQSDGTPIDRRSLKQTARRCILCGNDARWCIKGNHHDIASVIDSINRYIKEFGDSDVRIF